jgi:hypothetical protein
MRTLIAVVSLACACTSIPAPPERDAGRTPDAGIDSGPPPRECFEALRGTDRGPENLAFVHHTGAHRGMVWAAPAYTSTRTGEPFVIELFVVGRLDQVDGAAVALAGESNLRTCSHCVLVWRQCVGSSSTCAGDPYLPIAGRAYVHQAIDVEVDGGNLDGGTNRAPGFEIEIEGLVLAPARVDRTTLTTTFIAGDDDCVRIDSFRYAAVTQPGVCSDTRFGCALLDLSRTR